LQRVWICVPLICCTICCQQVALSLGVAHGGEHIKALRERSLRLRLLNLDQTTHDLTIEGRSPCREQDGWLPLYTSLCSDAILLGSFQLISQIFEHPGLKELGRVVDMIL